MYRNIWDLPTPAVLVEGRILQENISRMARWSADGGKGLRPHAKAHKCPDIARMQLQAGAEGFTTATLVESGEMIRAGAEKITLAMPLWDTGDLTRLEPLLEKAEITLVINDLDHAVHLNSLCAGMGLNFPVYWEVDTGLRRCGVLPDDILPETVAALEDLSNLKIVGLLSHGGHSYRASGRDELKLLATREGDDLLGARQRVGRTYWSLSVGATPTAGFSAAIPGLDQLRPGNYVFNDGMQVALGAAVPEQCSLTVLAQVVGSYPDRVVINAGAKSLALDQGVHGSGSVRGYGCLVSREGILSRLSEEHGILDRNPGFQGGEKIRILPNHACPVCNLTDVIYIVDGDRVVDSFPVTARGHQSF